MPSSGISNETRTTLTRKGRGYWGAEYVADSSRKEQIPKEVRGTHRVLVFDHPSDKTRPNAAPSSGKYAIGYAECQKTWQRGGQHAPKDKGHNRSQDQHDAPQDPRIYFIGKVPHREIAECRGTVQQCQCERGVCFRDSELAGKRFSQVREAYEDCERGREKCKN
jgi:hypothetical protein